MSVTNNNIRGIHRKEWQFMTPFPVTSVAGALEISDSNGIDDFALFLVSSTVSYLYSHEEDSFVNVPSPALAGTFGAGTCGARSRWSATVTANGGSSTSANTANAITGLCIGKTIRFLTGANAGKESIVTDALIIPGGTSTIYFDDLGAAVANTDTFIIDTGRFFIINAGTQAAGSFKYFDLLTMTWINATQTGLPATIGTDGKLVSTPSYDIFASGLATSGTSTTLVNSAKTWGVNQFCNYQIKIIGGTGSGQIRSIVSNTATTITVLAWTTIPDATSQYQITGNDDYLYFLGNNAVAMYRYSISSATWSTITPTAARAGNPGVGFSATWVGKTENQKWADESDLKDGRYIYSFRGNAQLALERFDIAGGATGNGTWLSINPVGFYDGFTTGSSYIWSDKFIYIRKDATQRYFKFDINKNVILPFSTNFYPDGTALLGHKIWIKHYFENGVKKLSWLYSWRNSGTEIHRILIF